MAALSRKKDDDTPDDKATASAGSGTERTSGPGDATEEQVGPPEQPASALTIKLEDHELDVDVTDGPGSIDTSDEDSPRSVENLSAEDLQRLQRALLDENARRGNLPQNRPFADVDKESLLILQNQLRGELASR